MANFQIETPSNVGILALEIYFPGQYVNQTELEKFDNVSEGKYTIGLGQKNMGFCMDHEDVASMCLTVVSRLLSKNKICTSQIGRLDVGTESIIDKSKSIKSILMQLFEDSGNFDVEGVDNINACYGGTAALFNAINWVESSSCNEKYALVVAADNAVYESGPARPTGGAGAIAMLIGTKAPLVIDKGSRTSYMRHAYDFYKPNLASEYPVVDGKLSIECYLSSLDATYQGYFKKLQRSQQEFQGDLSHFDSMIFHAPYCKLVQKSLARLAYIDFRAKSQENLSSKLQAFREKKLNETYFDKDIERHFMETSNEDFEKKTKPSLYLASEVGNMYTPSVYAGLVSLLISANKTDLPGKRIGVFSYGSGSTSSFFSISVHEYSDPAIISKLVDDLRSDVLKMLACRTKVSPQEYTKVLAQRQENYNKVPFIPTSNMINLFKDQWYLVKIDENGRRFYANSDSNTASIKNC